MTSSDKMFSLLTWLFIKLRNLDEYFSGPREEWSPPQNLNRENTNKYIDIHKIIAPT